MDRLFLDANILFSASYGFGGGLEALWHLDDVKLLASEYVISEARRNIHTSEQLARLGRLLRSVRVVAEAPADAAPIEVDLPEKDRPVLHAALQAGATHLITGDVRHFGPYYRRGIAGLLILSPSDYLVSR